jgi:hypothetical protein
MEEKDPPDAWVRLDDGREEQVEITEVQEPGRRRGDEYKRGLVSASRFVPSDKIAEHVKSILLQLVKTIEAKVGRYDFKPRLLIYLNFPYGPAEALMKKAIAQIRETYADEFCEIHVLTDTNML